MSNTVRSALVKPMQARSPEESHRTSTSLELLFDLVFVVAVALASAYLHHGIAENHTIHAVLSFFMTFFAIWWAWMGFTWFASAYDVDDFPYRLLVLLQMIGALVLAAGIPSAFENSDFSLVTVGYVIMRIALISQWIRAWRADVMRRATIQVYIVGLFVLQMAWVALLFAPAQFKYIGFIILVIGELMIPILAEGKGFTPFNLEHITERYGLFTIIVLGESILAASTAFQYAFKNEQLNPEIIKVAIGGVLTLFSMWWLYFIQKEHPINTSLKKAIFWGYGHYFMFVAAAALGAGLGVMVDFYLGKSHISSVAAGMAVAIPVVVFIISLAIVHGRIERINAPFVAFVCSILAILATPWLKDTALWIGVILSLYLSFILLKTAAQPNHE
jgi:low temperature requirement protein LtrA